MFFFTLSVSTVVVSLPSSLAVATVNLIESKAILVDDFELDLTLNFIVAILEVPTLPLLVNFKTVLPVVSSVLLPFQESSLVIFISSRTVLS